MTITVEDGTIVAGANSYATVAELQDYMEARQQTALSAGEAESFLIQAAQYLMQYEARFKGSRVSADQTLSWPRTGACVNGFEVADTAIPSQIKTAQLQLSMDASAGTPFFVSTDGSYVVREKVDVLETQYASPTDLKAAGLVGSSFPAAESILRPLLRGRQISVSRAW